MRVVIDTGVAISAVLLPGSVPRRAFDAGARADRLLISQATIGELDEVLRRPKFDKYVTEALRLEFLAALAQIAEVIDITEQVVACRDPDDDKFLSLAVSGKADYLISGDRDLLILHPFRGISVITPADYLALATASPP